MPSEESFEKSKEKKKKKYLNDDSISKVDFEKSVEMDLLYFSRTIEIIYIFLRGKNVHIRGCIFL